MELVSCKLLFNNEPFLRFYIVTSEGLPNWLFPSNTTGEGDITQAFLSDPFNTD